TGHTIWGGLQLQTVESHLSHLKNFTASAVKTVKEAAATGKVIAVPKKTNAATEKMAEVMKECNIKIKNFAAGSLYQQVSRLIDSLEIVKDMPRVTNKELAALYYEALAPLVDKADLKEADIISALEITH
ncbi:MAG TPA: hypothetical protein VN457_03745, partial [Chlamydiales bacterium]|nr:hypothetical protein [Chlamydiales bacterium]